MQRNKALLGCLIFLIATPFAFTQSVQIVGHITNDSDVEGIHVLNKSAGLNSITDHGGNFVIEAAINDTIWFSSLRYMLREVVITPEVASNRSLEIQLDDAVNLLDEVIVGNQLSGDLRKDVSAIQVEKPLNFEDVGIPGFKGKPEEKIVPIVPGIGTFTTVDIESLYKHLSGYYKKLRLRRKWEGQNVTVLQILGIYGETFFVQAYEIPSNRLYDFLLFCIETSQLERELKNKNYSNILAVFKEKAALYKERMQSKED